MAMNIHASKKLQEISVDVDAVAKLIVASQKDDGEIPWSPGDKTDPWDHVEAAMGLVVGGYFEEAGRAFQWMSDRQLVDGSWYSSFRDGMPDDKTRESNHSSYLAVGLLHYYLVTGDVDLLRDMWDTLCNGIEFALSLQTPKGEIYWAVSPENRIDRMALLTGCSSIYMSIKCALLIADRLGYHKPKWKTALRNLGHAIQNKSYLFNMTKSRFSMDWFYPVLAGVLTGDDAKKRIDTYWKKFVIRGHGVRCVSDEPWITLAETSELALTLSSMGNFDLSRIIFNWICDRKYEDGSYWCGFTYPDIITWPEDKITWSNAVVLLAADTLYELTPAHKLFSHQFWSSTSVLT